jgi:hypothetical protein
MKKSITAPGVKRGLFIQIMVYSEERPCNYPSRTSRKKQYKVVAEEIFSQNTN